MLRHYNSQSTVSRDEYLANIGGIFRMCR